MFVFYYATHDRLIFGITPLTWLNNIEIRSYWLKDILNSGGCPIRNLSTDYTDFHKLNVFIIRCLQTYGLSFLCNLCQSVDLLDSPFRAQKMGREDAN